MPTIDYEIFIRFESYVDRMKTYTSTSGRNQHGKMMIEFLDNHKELREYWEYDESKFLWIDRFIKIKDPYDPNSYLRNNKEFRHHSYIVWLVKSNLIKVGKSSRLDARISELREQYGQTMLIKTFPFKSEEDAYLMEVLLHRYFKEMKDTTFFPQDRFGGVDFNKIDIKQLEMVADKVRTMHWFESQAPSTLKWNQLYRKNKNRGR